MNFITEITLGDCKCDQFYQVEVCTERDEDCAVSLQISTDRLSMKSRHSIKPNLHGRRDATRLDRVVALRQRFYSSRSVNKPN